MISKLKAFGATLKREFKVYRLVLADPRTPRLAKLVLGVAVVYTLLPFDVIPDFIPVLGQIDDIIIVPGLVLLALKLVPGEVIEDCRARANSLHPPLNLPLAKGEIKRR